MAVSAAAIAALVAKAAAATLAANTLSKMGGGAAPGVTGLSGLGLQPPPAPIQPSLVGGTFTGAPPSVSVEPQLGVQGAPTTPPPVAPAATTLTQSPQFGIDAFGSTAPAASADIAGVPVGETVQPLAAPAQIATDAQQLAQGVPTGVQQPQPVTAIPQNQAAVEQRIQELQAELDQVKEENIERLQQGTADLEMVREQRTQQAQAQAQAQQQAAGGLFPPGASAPLKGVLLLDLINKLNTGGTPAILQGRDFGAGAAAPQITQEGIAQIAGATAAVNAARAKVSAISDPDTRDAMIDFQTEKIASVFNLPVGDPRIEQIRVLVSRPSDIPDLQTISSDPRLKGLWNAITSGASGEELIDDYVKAQPIFDTINEEKYVAAGGGRELDALVQHVKSNPDQFPAIDPDNLTMNDIEFVNEQLPFNTGFEPGEQAYRIGDSGIAAIKTSQLLRRRHGITTEKTAEAIAAERAERGVAQEFQTGITILTPDGRRRFSFDGGRTIREGGQDIPTPDGSVKLGLAREGVSPEDLLGKRSPKEFAKLREQEIKIREFKSMSDRTKTLFSEEALSNPGRIASAVNSLVNQAEGLAKLSGKTFQIGEKEVTAAEMRKVVEDRNANLIRNTWGLGRTASDQARIQSAIVGLAFAAAAAAEQTGKDVSDRDVERFTKRIGENADPQIFAQVLTDLERDMLSGFEARHTVLTHGIEGAPPFPEDLRELFSDVAPAAAQTGNRFETSSFDELMEFNTPEAARQLSEQEKQQVRERLQQLGF